MKINIENIKKETLKNNKEFFFSTDDFIYNNKFINEKHKTKLLIYVHENIVTIDGYYYTEHMWEKLPDLVLDKIKNWQLESFDWENITSKDKE